jgi:hypothetical protein
MPIFANGFYKHASNLRELQEKSTVRRNHEEDFHIIRLI